MSHVIEHLYHPAETFAQIRRVLRPGGILHIATPNPSGYSAQTFGSNWFGLDCPRHIILYTPETLARQVECAGFKTTEIIPLPVIKDAVRSAARAQGEVPPWPLDRDGWRALKWAFLIRREAEAARFDQYHLFARPKS
jgi:hypothetical protein